MTQAPKRVIKLSELPTRKFVPEEPITNELRAKWEAQSRSSAASPSSNHKDAGSVHIDATVAAPIVVDTYVSCDAVSVDC